MSNNVILPFEPEASTMAPDPSKNAPVSGGTLELNQIDLNLSNDTLEPLINNDELAKNRFLAQYENGFVALPKKIEDCKAFAQYISRSLLVPPALRNKPETVYMLIARAASLGISWANLFSTFFVIVDKYSNTTVGMYVNAKAAMCIKRGCWNIELNYKTGDTTVSGRRYDTGHEMTITYTGYEASLLGKLKHDANGQAYGVEKWADKWIDMMKKRALGRFLDALFPDVVGGFVSKEDYDDQAYADFLENSAEPVKVTDSNLAAEASASMERIRRGGRSKAISSPDSNELETI